jgi:filamentous hemagglutinin family protein
MMMIQNWHPFWRLGLTTLAVAGALLDGAALAQITPDNTLGAESSRVRRNAIVRGGEAELIEGGAVRNSNLFHSFEDFNVAERQRVYFENPAGIDNILSRVTGENPSNILGTLGVDGAANLFLLNPNGILFGPNASLDVEGSFLASTADRFTFADGTDFSATNPQASSLLTVSVPLGVQRGSTPVGHIVNDGDLQVGAEQHLTLFGNTVVHRGRLSTPGGRVSLLGNRVAMMEAAQVDVASATGGGAVLIGGDLRGQGMLPTAQTVYVAPNAAIDASATVQGDGGQVIVWADEATFFAGNIVTRGGAVAGDGGFVEISGQQFLAYQGQTDAQAPHGAVGTLLLDPSNIRIVADPGETLDLGQVDFPMWGAMGTPWWGQEHSLARPRTWCCRLRKISSLRVRCPLRQVAWG